MHEYNFVGSFVEGNVFGIAGWVGSVLLFIGRPG